TSLQLPGKSKTLELKPEEKKFTSSLEKKKERPIFVTQLTPAAVTIGNSARFTVTISGFPKPNVQWFHNGKVIKTSSIYKIVEERDEYSLIITEVKKEYEGEYSCTASNKFGQTTCTTTLKVQVSDVPPAEKWVEEMFKIPGEPPHFTTQIIPVQCAEGCEAKFQYKVIGTPHPQVQWFKGNQEIKPSLNCCVVTDPDGTGFLIMIDAQQRDSGLYTCRASNPFGEATCSAELIVIRKIIICFDLFEFWLLVSLCITVSMFYNVLYSYFYHRTPFFQKGAGVSGGSEGTYSHVPVRSYRHCPI
ncbi:titin-like, partial [Astyanax mexicanus]